MKNAKTALNLEKLRTLTPEATATVRGGTQSGTSVISVSGGTSVIQPGTSRMTIGTSGPSVISVSH